ncbi:DUF2911 domain-containing protein [Rufibacter tibetensis]|uniref:Asparagine synthetase B n=1 Tax=Rufibacter tibetensis TaxID=512763 RepID=A0A0N7HWY0_9BACT|nr:DUF2911 domain-containing protein [Rufibacter tibetensis]ALJ00505.1 hypothetical protein DC20_17930 [Rufibacter tibetensis]
MNSQKKNFLVLTVLFLLAMTSSVFAQDAPKPKASPAQTATGKVGAANISIAYSSPSVKGRKVWGELVPYGKAWRAGANEATTFTTDKDIMVQGKALKAGKYSLFMVPGEKEWQIIFNSQTGQWGTNRQGANFDPANNVLTVNVTPKKAAKMNEALAYNITPKGFSLLWENLEVPVAIK